MLISVLVGFVVALPAMATFASKNTSSPVISTGNNAHFGQIVAMCDEPTDGQNGSDAVPIGALGRQFLGWSDGRGVSLATGTLSTLKVCEPHPGVCLPPLRGGKSNNSSKLGIKARFRRLLLPMSQGYAH